MVGALAGHFFYWRNTVLVVAVDQRPLHLASPGRPAVAGMLRLQFSSWRGLASVKGMREWIKGWRKRAGLAKAFTDHDLLGDAQYRPGMMDITMIAVPKWYRETRNTDGAQISLLLLHKMCDVIEEGVPGWRPEGWGSKDLVTHWVTILAKRPYARIQRLGKPWLDFGESFGWKPYFGSRASRPFHGCYRVWRDHVQQELPGIYDQLRGAGLMQWANLCVRRRGEVSATSSESSGAELAA